MDLGFIEMVDISLDDPPPSGSEQPLLAPKQQIQDILL